MVVQLQPVPTFPGPLTVGCYLFERFGEDLLILGGPLYMIDDEPVNRSPARFEFEA
jgi:hypothetical protein